MQTAIEMLRRADRGDLMSDMDKELRKIVKAIEENGSGKGQIKITLDIAAKGEMYLVESKLESKVPQKPRKAAPMFLGEDNSLTARDTRQPDLPTVVDADKANANRKG